MDYVGHAVDDGDYAEMGDVESFYVCGEADDIAVTKSREYVFAFDGVAFYVGETMVAESGFDVFYGAIVAFIGEGGVFVAMGAHEVE